LSTIPMTTKTMLIRRKTHAGQLGLMGRRVAMVNGPGSRARLCLGRSGRTESALLAVSTCTWIGIMKDDAAVRTLGGCDIRIGDAAVRTLGGCDASPRIPSHPFGSFLKTNLPSTRSCSGHRPSPHHTSRRHCRCKVAAGCSLFPTPSPA
jgi:hypothetical protein